MVLFPAFTAIDVFGPLNALNLLSIQHNMTLAMVSHDMKPISIDRTIIDGVGYGNLASSASPFFTEYVLPSHTFDNATDFDVIMVPGGGGTRNLTATQPAVDWLSTQLGDSGEEGWPSYVMTICTGTALLSRTLKIGGKNATTNKAAFNWVKTQQGAQDVNWIPRARWVVDGKLWTSSGVSAGTDMTLGWIEHVHGRNESERVRLLMEWNALDQEDDPFADYYDL
ncbi:class I glutamine amidotransferase-like protein [Stachybotrys elegans]|uniref:Class I glutamine amidotransferase-like protein n=1 Tax=Stachybotrys elegans TaxID=80388 RepID=A0A8K0WLU3_9HYPO|nr:class I glutamine amidotransferase-like protein [Stachybotrys elegans]